MTQSWAQNFSSASADAASIYENVMVPSVFNPWAEVLLDLVTPRPGEAVIDVACGPGTVARLAAARVGPDGTVLGVDFSPAMLATARAKPPVEGGATVEYAEAPADHLPAGDASFDVVTCQQGLQFFPDRPAAVGEIRRVLRPGGRAAIAVWCEVDSSPPFAAVAGAVAEVLGEDPAAMYRGGPWGMGGHAVDELCRAAGFGSVEGERRSLPVALAGGADVMFSTLAVTAIAQQVGALDDERGPALRQAIARRLAPLMVDGVIRSHATSHLTVARL
jgi:SAM-dependent methyltransferase